METNEASLVHKLREVLGDALDDYADYSPIANEISEALELPDRQCDVGSAEDQVRRFSEFCDLSKSCRSCPVYKPKFTAIECFARWAQMTYDEGGGKHEQK